MATEHTPSVRLDRDALTRLQLRVLEMALYQIADAINRLKPDGQPPYTKMEVPNG